MAQPEFVPVSLIDDVRPSEATPPSRRWVADRPGDIASGDLPEGDGFGNQGPDQGYALFLAKRFYDKLELAPGEHRADVVAGCFAVATKRSSIFGRGPVVYDFELAFALFGFLGGATTEMIRKRGEMFAEAAHDYWKRRAIADAVPESTLRMTPAVVRGGLANWQDLLSL